MQLLPSDKYVDPNSLTEKEIENDIIKVTNRMSYFICKVGLHFAAMTIIFGSIVSFFVLNALENGQHLHEIEPFIEDHAARKSFIIGAIFRGIPFVYAHDNFENIVKLGAIIVFGVLSYRSRLVKFNGIGTSLEHKKTERKFLKHLYIGMYFWTYCYGVGAFIFVVIGVLAAVYVGCAIRRDKEVGGFSLYQLRYFHLCAYFGIIASLFCFVARPFGNLANLFFAFTVFNVLRMFLFPRKDLCYISNSHIDAIRLQRRQYDIENNDEEGYLRVIEAYMWQGLVSRLLAFLCIFTIITYFLGLSMPSVITINEFIHHLRFPGYMTLEQTNVFLQQFYKF